MKSASTFVSFTFELIYNTIQKCGVSKIKKKKKFYTFTQQGCIKLLKSDSEGIYNVTKNVSNNCSFELFIRQIMYHSFHKIY